MTTDIQSGHWGALSVMSLNAPSLALGGRGTLYSLRNGDTEECYLFALLDLGFSASFGIKVNQQVKNLWKVIVGGKNLIDSSLYTPIQANRPFSADDLNFAPGAEATAGAVVLSAAVSATTISAWPFFESPSEPGAEVNNDYFTGATIYSTTDIGLSAGIAYQFLGRWIRLCTLVEESGEIAMYDAADDSVLMENLARYA